MILNWMQVGWNENSQGLLQNIPVSLGILSGFLPEAGTLKKRDVIDGNVLHI